MANNEEGEPEAGGSQNIDPQPERDELIEKLKLVVTETEEIKNSQKRKFDEIAEKLQSMEKSIAKIPKFDDDEKKFTSDVSNKKPNLVKKFVMKEAFENIANFKVGDLATSKKEDHFNVNWCMEIEPNETHLEFYVFCEPIAPVEDKWSIETKLEFKIVGNDYDSVIKTMKCCFDKNDAHGYEDFIKLEDIKDYYLIDNKLNVEMEIEILKIIGFEKPKARVFDESQKDVSDIILVVQDTEFYVSKTYLAAQSAFFKTLFFGNFSESKMSKIPLTGIESADFQLFLEVLYGESVIDDSTVEGILSVADLYDTPIVVKKCQRFLLKVSKKEFKKKLQLSTQYRLEKLKTQCLSKINTIADVRVLLPGDLSDLDSSVAHRILQKCASLP
ncbi:unnamed protein product [Caenorhabditis nigoni]